MCVIFAILFFANHFTFLCQDDFGYIYHCEYGTELHSLGDYFSSIRYHTAVCNGRYIAHFLAQLCLNMPKRAFNIINSIIYCLQIFLCYMICCPKKNNNILLLGLFGATWVFEPLFGDVNLWVTGSCNYLWAIVATLIFVFPYFNFFLNETNTNSSILKTAFVVFAFIAGAWSEASSATAIGCAVLLCLLSMKTGKSKPRPYHYLALASSLAGYASLVFSPSEINAKVSAQSVYMLFQNFKYCVIIYYGFLPLILVYIVLLVLCLRRNDSRKFIISSLVCFAASLFANYIFTFGTNYPGRCASTSSIYLILALGILAGFLYRNEERQWSVIIPLLIVPSLFFNLVFGLDDIRLTNYISRQVVSYIEDCKSSGITEVKYPIIEGATTYSIYYSGTQVNINTPDIWPNNSMAKYFGVEKVYGVESVEEIEQISPIM